jgi:hypothetical protein
MQAAVGEPGAELCAEPLHAGGETFLAGRIGKMVQSHDSILTQPEMRTATGVGRPNGSGHRFSCYGVGPESTDHGGGEGDQFQHSCRVVGGQPGVLATDVEPGLDHVLRGVDGLSGCDALEEPGSQLAFVVFGWV